MANHNVEYYFVLNGLWNGEEGYPAMTIGADHNDKPQADGWYWLLEGDDDGHGPFLSRDAAVRGFAEAEADIADEA